MRIFEILRIRYKIHTSHWKVMRIFRKIKNFIILQYRKLDWYFDKKNVKKFIKLGYAQSEYDLNFPKGGFVNPHLWDKEYLKYMMSNLVNKDEKFDKQKFKDKGDTFNITTGLEK